MNLVKFSPGQYVSLGKATPIFQDKYTISFISAMHKTRSTEAAPVIDDTPIYVDLHYMRVADDKLKCLYCSETKQIYKKSLGSLTPHEWWERPKARNEWWDNSGARRHFIDKHKLYVLPQFPSDNVQLTQKVAYCLRAICGHKQCIEFLSAPDVNYLCCCDGSDSPRRMKDAFEHIDQMLENIRSLVRPEMFATTNECPAPTDGASVVKRKRNAAAISDNESPPPVSERTLRGPSFEVLASQSPAEIA